MSETGTMRPKVIAALRRLHAFAVENETAGPGTPDVNYIEGWIELKKLHRWPARQDTIVKIEHYSPQQRVFAVKRRRMGGNCWMLLQVANQWLLYDGAVAAVIFNKSTTKEMYEAAHKVWPAGLDKKELLECVSQTQKPFTFTADDLA